MKIAITGGTGFIGGYLIRHLAAAHELRCWYRDDNRIQPELKSSCAWIPGELGDERAAEQLVSDCQAVVHAALWKPGNTFRGGEGNIVEFCEKNILGTLKLIEAARQNQVRRFVFISTCAVHEQILNDRPLDEAHPLWPLTHYGAHKAAIEKFVHSYGFGHGYDICALRPTGVYGIDHPPKRSKWFDMVRQIVHGEPVKVAGGGKEVHAADVAKAAGILLQAEGIAGECYSCYDMYVAQYDVAQLAKKLSGSDSLISGKSKVPKHQIETGKIKKLGMQFGGENLLRETVAELIELAR